MAIHHRTQGFIFKKTDSGEADRVFTFFTKDFGRLEILARAERKIKSKLRGGLEIFYLVDIEFIQGKTHKTLTDTFLIENFKNIRNDLERLAIAYKIGEVLDKLIKGEEKDEKIWNLILETFKILANLQFTIYNLQLVYYYFLWNLLTILGYQPEIYFCSLCQEKLKPGKLYFSFKEGGVFCNLCFKKIKDGKEIDENFVKILRIILKRDWPTLKKLKIEEFQKKLLEDISESYLSYISEQNK